MIVSITQVLGKHVSVRSLDPWGFASCEGPVLHKSRSSAGGTVGVQRQEENFSSQQHARSIAHIHNSVWLVGNIFTNIRC